MQTADRIYALASIWSNAKEVYPYFDRLAVDWDASFREYLDRITAETDEKNSWLLLASFMRLLNDGHSTVLLPKRLMTENGIFPFGLTHVGERFLITEARDKKHLLREAIAIDGIPLPELVSRLNRWQYTVNGHPYRGRLERWLPILLSGKTHLMETDGEAISFRFADEREVFEHASEPAAQTASQAICENVRLFDPGILYVRIDDFQHTDRAEAFPSILKVQKPNAVLFDIRRNIGGMTLCGAKYAQPFFSGRFGGCRKWTQQRTAVDAASASQITRMSEARISQMLRDGILTQEALDDAQEYESRTKYERYNDTWEYPCGVYLPDCPVLVLTSRNTVSAAEDFAAFFRSNRRGILMGEPTFGSTGSPMPFRLPGEGAAQIVSAGYELLDGTPFSGCGIQPDVFCAPSPDDWRDGRDRQLDAAIAYLRK